MAFDTINIGAAPNDNTGDPLRSGGQKINDNFAKAVEGPASAVTTNRMVVFDGTTGKLVKQAAFVEADVARLSQTQTFTGAKSFTADVGIGTSSPSSFLTVEGTNVQVHFKIRDTSSLGSQYFYSTAGYNATISLGTIHIPGDNTDEAPFIRAASGSATTGDLLFGTRDTERLRITHTGLIQIPSGSPGIKFGTRNANLNDYEEATWTPTVVGGTTAGSASYDIRQGNYIKVGSLVTASCYVVWSGHNGSGALKITGLPFLSASQNMLYAGATYATDYNAGTNATQLVAFVQPSNNEIDFRGFVNNATRTDPQVQASGAIAVNVSYRAG